MPMADEEAVYPRGARLFHWTMAAIIILAWCIGLYSAHFRGDVPRGPVMALHKGLAATVLFLAAARLLYRLAARKRFPPHDPGLSGVEIVAARIGHAMLYLIAMIAAPLTGWYWSSIVGKPPALLGIVPLPAIAAPDASLYGAAQLAHRIATWSAGGLILLHLAAVAKHMLIDRTNILRRMIGRSNA